MELDYGHLTWEQAKGMKRGCIILPVGSMEQHGPHLPLATDTIIASEVARRVAERVKILIFPAIPVGFSPEHAGFSGTVSIAAGSYLAFCLDILGSFARNRITKIFIINGHGGNRPLLEAIVQEAARNFRIDAYVFTVLDVIIAKLQEIRESKEGEIGHADEIETSMMLAIEPSLVRMERAVRGRLRISGGLSFEPKRRRDVSFSWRAEDVSESGILGDPRSSSKEKGLVLLQQAVDSISAVIARIR